MSVSGRLRAKSGLSWAGRWLANIASGFAIVGRKPRVAKRDGRAPAWGKRLGILLAGLAAIVVITIVFDAWAIRHALLLPVWLVELFNALTDFGKSEWFLWPLGILLLVVASLAVLPMTQFSRLALAALAARFEFLFLAIALPGLFTAIVKRFIGRARPFVGGEADAYLYHPFAWRVEYASMPSGHATTALAVTLAFGAVWPRLRPLLWSYALVILASRVIVLAHHPSDVAAGALVGALGAILVRNMFAARGRVFMLDSRNEVKAMPGLSWARIKTIARAVRGQ